ncbi:hypothetical protein RUM43_007435 [Polyplax serrata]|uniref:Cytochrome P450 n=1 Tax=Polyplax serrata TaxID=468196 RepID=A0AAN8S5H0_POLSC
MVHLIKRRDLFFQFVIYWLTEVDDWTRELLYDVVDGFKKWGSTYRLWYSGIPVVLVSDLTDVQTVLSSRQANTKGIIYRNILPWLGSGLLTSSGKKWQTMRKIITPTFHFSVLHDYIDVFTKNAGVLLQVLDKESTREECDLPKFITHCALDNVCETAMGTCINALGAGCDSKYVQSIFRIGRIVVQRLFSPFLFANASFACSGMGWEHSRIVKLLHGFTTRIIKERKMLRESQKGTIIDTTTNTDTDECGNMYKKKRSFLDMLLESQDCYSLSSRDIREEVDTFMFEGHDTTSASLNWTLFELGHHLEIQERCFQEMERIFGDSDRCPTYHDLMEMSYLKRVIQEALRLYPSVPVISRKFDVDLQLKEYLVPAKTEIVLVLYAIHRNPDVYPEPDKFDPDRFLPEAVESRHSFAYIPFSAGQRNCIGQKFAMLEELVILSSIIRRFKIKSLNDRESLRVVPELILRPHENLRFKLTKRDDLS